MIDPIVQKILVGTIIYGIVICFAAAAFQAWRKESKSATVLGTMALVALLLLVVGRILRTM